MLVLLGLSSIFILLYFLGFYFACKKNNNASIITKILYISGGGAGISWYAAPIFMADFVPSSFGNIVSNLYYSNTVLIDKNIIILLWGIYIFIIYGFKGIKATISNTKVTADNPYKPKKLLTDGEYKFSRHPMLKNDFMAHLGWAFFIGSEKIITYIPIFYLINQTFVLIQESYVLKHLFKEEYKAYTNCTPSLFTKFDYVNMILSTVIYTIYI